MRRREVRKVRPRAYVSTIDVTTCDGCGVEIEPFDDDEITMTRDLTTTAHDAPDRHGQIHRFDVCAACWRSRVVPAMAAIGFPLRASELGEDGDCEPEEPTR